MVTNLPLVDGPNPLVWLAPVVVLAGAAGAWVARLERHVRFPRPAAEQLPQPVVRPAQQAA